jgi:hypothetical protein
MLRCSYVRHAPKLNGQRSRGACGKREALHAMELLLLNVPLVKRGEAIVFGDRSEKIFE